MKQIGSIIRELRREMDCTQNQLADVLGVTQDSISLWEHNKRIPDTQYIVVMANFFDVSTDYLLGISDDFSGVKFGHEGREKEWVSTEEKCLLSAYRTLSTEKKSEIQKIINS